MKLRQIAAATMLFYAVASFAAESQLEQAEENSDALVSDEIESAEASDSATAAETRKTAAVMFTCSNSASATPSSAEWDNVSPK